MGSPRYDQRGPTRIELEHRVAPEQARYFYGLMFQVGTIRSRSGGYDWSLARDVANAEGCIETYSCPTWLNDLRQRTRMTEAERELIAQAMAIQTPDLPI